MKRRLSISAIMAGVLLNHDLFTGESHEVFEKDTMIDSAEGYIVTTNMQDDTLTGEAFGETAGKVPASKDIHHLAGAVSAVASMDYASTAQVTEKLGEAYGDVFTAENFSSATPQDIASYNYGFNYGASRQEPLLEGIFPTIIQPIGTRAVNIAIDVDYIINPYGRNDAKSGASKDNAIPFVQTINDTNFYDNRNVLTPASDTKAAWDQFFVKPLEVDGVDVVSGNPIKVAPFVASKDIPLLDLGQSAVEALKGEFDQNTYLAPFPRVDNLYFNVATEYLKLDVTMSSDFAYVETSKGDSLDVALSAGGFITVEPGTLKNVLTGNLNTELAGIPANFKVVYSILFTGDGNLRDGYVNVYANKFEVVDIINAGGVSVPTTDASYAIYKTAADKLAVANYVGQDITSHIVNDDLSRTGRLLTLRSKDQNYVLEPDSPLSVSAPLSSMVTGSKKTDAKYIPFLVKYATASVNNKGIKAIVNYANFLRANANTDVLGVNSIGISRYLIKPWFKTTTLNLSADIDSLKSSERETDIKSAFDSVVKLLVADLTVSSGYTQAAIDKGVIDIWVGVHSSLAKFVGTTVDLGVGFDVRIYFTEKVEFINKAYLTVANFSSTRNTEIDVLSFGAHFYTPVLIGELGEVKDRKIVAQTISKHAVFTPIMAEINVTGLEASLSKIAQNTHGV